MNEQPKPISDVEHCLLACAGYIMGSSILDKDGILKLIRETRERLLADTSECETYHAPRIAELERLLEKAQGRIGDLAVIVGDIEQCRCIEGDAINILCDNPEEDDPEKVVAVEACGDYTGYEPQRFYGRTWIDALHKAAKCARNHYSENEDHE